MRFSMMWPSVFTYIRHRMLFPTGIKIQHVARLVESDLPSDRLVFISYYIYFIRLTSKLLIYYLRRLACS